MPTLSEVRSTANEQATCAFALFIEGLPYVWVTDHPDDVLRGSGASSWLGQYEADASYTDHETTGERTAIGGLRLPGSIARGNLNPNTGMLETTTLTIDLVDVEGVLASLFASEEEQPLTLAERLAPGTTALGATIDVESGTVDPADKHIGIECIGPARERRWHYPFPFQGIGLHHQNNPSSGQEDDGEGPALVQITDSPQIFAGRLVTLYRIYRTGSAGSYLDWPHWGDQHDAGGLEWWGVLQDRGEFRGDQTWSLQCWGPESLLRRRLGTVDVGWMPVNAVTDVPPPDHRSIGVAFKHGQLAAAGGFNETYDSAYFDNLTEANFDDAETLANAIATFCGGYADGSSSDFGGPTDFEADGGLFSFAREEVKVKGDVSVGGDGRFWVELCLHREVWRILGWSIDEQVVGVPQDPLDSLYQVHGLALDAGDKYTPGDNDGLLAPAEGYYTFKFTTTELGLGAFEEGTGDDQVWNAGAWRIYRPKHDFGDPVIMRQEGGQSFEVTATYPYVEPDPTVDPGTYDAGRWFMFKGQRAEEINGETETVDDYQVARVFWDFSASDYGSVEVPEASPRFYLDRWAMPRAFHIDRPRFQGDWATIAGDDDEELLCRPLNVYSYNTDTIDLFASAFEHTWIVLPQLLLSTGTGPGQSGGWSGDNTDPALQLAVCGDVASSEMGLGIPWQLVQPAQDIFDAFATANWDQFAPINECRYVYADSFESTDVIESILRPRGLAMTLRNGQYSVSNLVEYDLDDIDVVITETEIHGDIQDPRSVVPMQTLRATGPIDDIGLDASRSPATGDHNVRRDWSARDPGAKYRRGDIAVDLTDDGIVPQRFKYQNNTGDPLSGPWEDNSRNMWIYDQAIWNAKRHFVVETTLHRVAGQDVWPGTTVRYTNRWIYNPAGTLGVTGAVGVVLESTWDPGSETYAVRLFVHADQFDGTRCFAPIGKIADGWTGSGTVELVPDADFLNHGQGEDAARFVEPAWSGEGGNLTVVVLEHDSVTWTLHSADTQTVTAGSGTTVTLAGAFSTTFHSYSDKYLVAVDMTGQSGWPTSVLLPNVIDDHTWDGNKPGYPLEGS